MSRVLMLSSEPPLPGTAMEAHLGAVEQALKHHGVQVSCSWARRRGTGWTRLLDLLQWQVSTMWKVSRADLVYIRFHPLAPLVGMVCRVLRVPYVLEINGSLEDVHLAHPGLRTLRGGLQWLTKHQFRGAAGVIAVTPALLGWAQDLADQALTGIWLPNGADSTLAQRRRPPELPRYAVFLGQLAPWQGVGSILSAVRDDQWPSSLSLVVVGDGAARRQVEEAAQRDDRIIYLGGLERAATQDVLAGATLSLSPQPTDLARNQLGVSPLKVAESLMLGVPVVVSTVNVSAEQIREAGVGEVLCSDDSSELARAVGTLFEGAFRDPAMRDRAAALAAEHLSWSTVGSRTHAFLRGLLDARSDQVRKRRSRVGRQ